MNKPELRFKAADGSKFPEWEEKKITELFTRIVEKNRADLLPLTIIQGQGTVRRDESDRRIAYDKKGLKNYKAVKKDDFIVHLRSFEGGLEIANQDGIVSPAYHVYRGGGNVCPQFYYPYFHSNNFIKGRLAICVTGVRDGKNIEMDTFDELLLPCPSFPEQKKIATFLLTIDDIISTTKTELTAWEERKKGVMQKIFNREVRFKADDGSEFPEWEEKTFADVFENMNNNTFSRDCLNYSSGFAKNIHYGDILVKFNSYVDVMNDEIPYINKELSYSKYSYLQDGDIVIADTAEDETVGKAVEIENANNMVVVAGLHTIACRPKMKFAKRYLGYYLNSDTYHMQLRPYMQGIKVTSISKSNISLTTIIVPSLHEQKKIADCLSSLEDVINQIQAELSAWKEFKRGLLRKMFV